MQSLTHLNLNQNAIHSEFPEFIFECQNLTTLDLSRNQLTGQIPDLVFTKLGKLEYLNLNDNLFQGKIPTTIGQLRELQSLDLGMNSLNSSIPSELGHCTDLTHLSLASNFLSGELPQSLSNLNSILHLDFSDNAFTDSNDFGGQLPRQIGNLDLLSRLNVSRNHLTGVIPQSIGNFTQILYLDLSNNNLTGVIPLSIVTFTRIEFLDLSNNNLTGVIPPDSSSNFLLGLKIFNVSHNHLSGEIPSGFLNTDKLTIFDFSYNNLTGPIPTCGIFQNATFVGNYGMWRDAKGTAACDSSGGNSEINNDNQRLEPPTNELAKAVVLVMSLALACTRAHPISRPPMSFVVQKLSTQALPCLPEPFGNKALSTQTPQKSETLTRRARNTKFALSIGDFGKAAAKSVGDLIIECYMIMKFQKKLSPSHLVLRSKICDKIQTSFPCHHLRVMKFQIRSHLFDSESRISLYLGNEFLANLQIQDTQKLGKESPKPKSLETLRQRGTEHPDPSEVRSTHPPCPKRQLRALYRRHQKGRRQERRRIDPEATDRPDRSMGRGNTDKLPLSSSQGDEISDTVKLPLSSSQSSFLPPDIYSIDSMLCVHVYGAFLLLPACWSCGHHQVSVVIPLLELKRATKSMRDGSNISSYLFHWNQLFPWPQSGMVSTVKALCFEVQLPKPTQELFQWAQVMMRLLVFQSPHINEQLSYASPSKKRLDAISVFIMDAHTFELYTSSLNKMTSSRPKKLSRCSLHTPQSNFDEEDPVNNGIGDDPKRNWFNPAKLFMLMIASVKIRYFRFYFNYSPSPLHSWSFANLDNLCNWTAIVCHRNTKTVSKIDLSNLGIIATLTNFNFTPFLNLTHFNLSHNNFQGPIPSAIGNLSMLTILDLGNNFFEQEIPAEIGLLTKLEYLSFFNNSLKGTIPYQLSNLQKVQFLLLAENDLKTSNWSKFSGMHSLPHLDLHQNAIHSEFPEFIFECQNLTFLDLSHNQLTGHIPDLAFTKLGKLEYLYLNDNLFQGKIPTTIGQLRELRFLDLGMNSLNSLIPSDLGHCTHLTYLFLASNFLSGELPQSLSNLSSILWLDFSDNVFTGPILPSVISNWSLVVDLNLRGNSFSGNIPPELGQLTNLKYLRLDSNDFGGELPSQIGNLNLLYSLTVSRNHLTGVSISNFTQIVYLDLSNNNLTGVIPQSIGNFTRIQFLDLSNNHLTGVIPRRIGNFTQISYLNLSNNYLTGVIPPDHGMFDNLQFCNQLDFSSNLLSGAIPSYLGMLTGLEIFNISHNHLSGEIPSEFSNMDTLTIYDFSYNNLTGPIPTCGIFREAPGDAFIGNYRMWRDARGTAACNSSGTDGVVVIITFLGFYLVETIIDQRLEPPTYELAKAVVLVMSLALACTRTHPISRPPMSFVAQKLSAQAMPCLPESFDFLSISKLMGLGLQANGS
ncbi:hypothetical protein DVH24_010544 [Malus domestica]|uniref:Disease resistance R13L4/SHOC-2-like LRR domain-containing protein n=1 Tax=Malus domestica TaxID=3750 RepID=A0A498JQJ6_MALDO|nr:hypothetical protein DVH24_010544 [Malus domestica]